MNPYCKVYLDSPLPKDVILARLAEWAGGQFHMRTITAEAFEADVVDNEDFDSLRKQGVDDSFLFYRYYLDIGPNFKVADEEYVGAIHGLLEMVRAEGMTAVASCDFEHLLPSVP